MSPALLSRSPDLQRLRDEGYDIGVRAGHLVMGSIPYVNSRGEIAYGMLVSTLALAGDVTTRPDTHVAYFSGDYPCHKDGTPIRTIEHQSCTQTLGDGITVHHSFSSKPDAGYYEDYYEKMSTYAAIISSPAQALNPSVTPKTFPVIEDDDGESVFNYIDTASSRAGIANVSRKLERHRVAIIGLGGTGSYVLDLVAKTPVAQIHLFDGDTFSQHNAFRSPGAPSVEELRARPTKVAYFQAIYSKMRRGIVPRPEQVDGSNVALLQGCDFAFLCLDDGPAKRPIVQALLDAGTPFIDVGMGVELVDDALLGILRVTTGSTTRREHLAKRMPFAEQDGPGEYDLNIQIADLNALNAALAVIKWKKLCGFYLDQEHEHNTTYTIGGNMVINEDQS